MLAFASMVKLPTKRWHGRHLVPTGGIRLRSIQIQYVYSWWPLLMSVHVSCIKHFEWPFTFNDIDRVINKGDPILLTFWFRCLFVRNEGHLIFLIVCNVYFYLYHRWYYHQQMLHTLSLVGTVVNVDLRTKVLVLCFFRYFFLCLVWVFPC